MFSCPFIIDKALFLLYILLVFKELKFGFAGKSMVESKNLKLKLGLCGLALTSFLALNSRSVVHADTVSGNNADAITWDSDNDDSQVVKEEPQQDNSSQSVQTQGAVQSSVQKQKAPATQSVQSNNQNRAEKSAVRVSNFDTSTVNRLNANSVRNNQVKVATVHDTAQMPVQKTRVAQFNNGSKIYTLNGSNQLSKNNGDGYVITNAGTYNGRAVDIGVTINGVQDNQGTYTTKWSNGDKADITGKTDANFKYQDSVLLNQQQLAPQVDQSRTRTRTETKQVPYKYTFRLRHEGAADWGIQDQLDDDITDLFLKYFTSSSNNETGTDKYCYAFDKAAIDDINGHDYPVDSTNVYEVFSERMHNETSSYNESEGAYEDPSNHRLATTPGATLEDRLNNILADTKQGEASTFIKATATGHSEGMDDICGFELAVGHGTDAHKISESVPVTDHLQLASSTPASLGYNYTVGLYDAQTGDLITDLKAEYKGKTGVQATASDSVMNNAIKDKIQQINQGQATASYTGTSANDDVAFYQETRQVNPQDKNVNRQVQRVIHINFPNGVKPKSYDSITDSAGNKLTLDSNNNLTQSMSFTRTGTENIVSGQVTYGNWQQHGAINAVTLPAIPGYTMVTTN